MDLFVWTFLIFNLFIIFATNKGYVLQDDKQLLQNVVGEKLSANQMLISVWADAALKWYKNMTCIENTTACNVIRQKEKNQFRIFAAELNAAGRYRILFPDADPKVENPHDAVLILDPFPNSRFGHPILVFYVDIKISRLACETTTGFYVGDGACLHMIQKTSCVNRAPELSKLWHYRCEMNLLPLVYLEYERQSQLNNQLKCYAYASFNGFNDSCPDLRPAPETEYATCDPLQTNKNCFRLENYFRNQCSTSRTCDNAVLLSGGWDRQLSDISTFHNVINVKRILMAHGFTESNIKTFFANGLNDDTPGMEDTEEPIFSATMKFALRNHIRTMCDFKHCSDSLLIYLNSPSKVDGSALLWDANNDGLYDDTEIYTARELLRDIGHCKANRVIVIADQSYSGSLVTAAEARFISLENVVIFGMTENLDHVPRPIDHLTKHFLRAKYTDICLNDFKQFWNHPIQYPIYVGSKPGLLNSTLVGGPCTETTSYLTDSSTSVFRGCHLSPLINDV